MPWNDPDPKKDYARIRVKNAVKSGHLLKPKMCSNCGDSGLIHGHHDNYEKPLEVVWLCPSCHKDRHNWIADVGVALVRQMDKVYIRAVSVAKELVSSPALLSMQHPPNTLELQNRGALERWGRGLIISELQRSNEH